MSRDAPCYVGVPHYCRAQYRKRGGLSYLARSGRNYINLLDSAAPTLAIRSSRVKQVRLDSYTFIYHLHSSLSDYFKVLRFNLEIPDI